MKLQFVKLALVVTGVLPVAIAFPHQHSLVYSVPAYVYPPDVQNAMYFSSVIASSASMLPTSVRPTGELGALRSSGAQLTKAKPFDVMSVYGRAETVGAIEGYVVFVLEEAGVAVLTGIEVDVEVPDVEAGATDTLLLADLTTTNVAAMHGFEGSNAGLSGGV